MDFAQQARIAAQLVAESERIRKLLGIHTVLFKIPDAGAFNARYELIEAADGVWHLVHLEDEAYTSHFIISKPAMKELAGRIWTEMK